MKLMKQHLVLSLLREKSTHKLYLADSLFDHTHKFTG